MSDEKKQYTAEGIPEQPPHEPTCTTLTSETIRVSWTPPPAASANGVIKGYKVIYGPSDTWYGMYHCSLHIAELVLECLLLVTIAAPI